MPTSYPQTKISHAATILAVIMAIALIDGIVETICYYLGA